jgi:dihydrofolate reductase
MSKVMAAITVSVDGYVTGPDDGPAQGLGVGGERLHNWVFGGDWTYDAPPEGPATGEDQAWLERAMADMGAVVAGRWTYEAAGHWGGSNPWEVPLFIVTHRPEEQPDGDDFRFVDGLSQAIAQAQAAAGDRNVHVMGGADIIRQALDAGLVDDLSLIVSPVVLGGGKRLFEGYDGSLELEHLGVRQSPHATFIDYRVRR